MNNDPKISNGQWGIYAKLKESILSLRLSIIEESQKRINEIRESAVSLVNLTTAMINEIKSDVAKNTIAEQSIPKVKAMIRKSDFVFKKQIEHFLTNVAVIEIDQNKGNSFENDLNFSAQSTVSTRNSAIFERKTCHWGTFTQEGKRKPLPEWIVSQINNGEKLNCKEIMIYKGNVITSIADTREMKYYWADPRGVKSGKGLKLYRA